MSRENVTEEKTPASSISQNRVGLGVLMTGSKELWTVILSQALETVTGSS